MPVIADVDSPFGIRMETREFRIESRILNVGWTQESEANIQEYTHVDIEAELRKMCVDNMRDKSEEILKAWVSKNFPPRRIKKDLVF